ncbi:hypothetical protein OIU84_002380 [Salix udensis]|uniref:Uncharacterized protein n=1 Tax=Salix udensis TaxID=889485 RepID=A0AAD6K463_9ROSI|nr:hypothetical protein OIU84_002380 [Salix udensis]
MATKTPTRFHLELLFLRELMKVLCQEIKSVTLGAMVSFLVAELTLFQNYGFVDPYGRANSDGENTAGGGSATSGPCWSKMEEPSHEVAKRTCSSHTAILEVTDQPAGSKFIDIFAPVLPPLHTDFYVA